MVSHLLNTDDRLTAKKTKIVCTLGPKTFSIDAITKLRKMGMDVARLNGAQGDLEWHKQAIQLVRAVDPLISILVDIPGRKIRTTELDAPYPVKIGDLVIFTTITLPKDPHKIPVNYAKLHEDLKEGDHILVDDGTLFFTVVKIDGHDIHCQAENNGQVKSFKGVNVPYVKVNSPVVSERDKAILEFCQKEGVDYIGLSFVENAGDVYQVRGVLSGSDVGIIAKIENSRGIENLEEILAVSDAIMIDRGDLGAETSVEQIGLLQKKVVHIATQQGVPVIIATEMLNSMIENPMPTKAEVNDITNAILDGASAVMLSGESAVGKYPFESVKLLSDVIRQTEVYLNQMGNPLKVGDIKDTSNTIGRAVYDITRSLNIDKIVSIASTGYSAKMIARYRGQAKIIIAINTIEKARKMNLIWGSEVVVIPFTLDPSSTEHIMVVIQALIDQKLLLDDDKFILVSAKHEFYTTKMNSLEVHSVASLKKLTHW